jgi:hypothetical protein
MLQHGVESKHSRALLWESVFYLHLIVGFSLTSTESPNLAEKRIALANVREMVTAHNANKWPVSGFPTGRP